jgi:hypothetical protein
MSTVHPPKLFCYSSEAVRVYFLIDHENHNPSTILVLIPQIPPLLATYFQASNELFRFAFEVLWFQALVKLYRTMYTSLIYFKLMHGLLTTIKHKPCVCVRVCHVPLCYGQLRLLDIEFPSDYDFSFYHGRKLQTTSTNISVSYHHKF